MINKIFLYFSLFTLWFYTDATGNSVVFSRDILVIESTRSIPVTKVNEKKTQHNDIKNVGPTEPEGKKTQEESFQTITATHEFIITTRNASSQTANWIYDATDVRDNFGILYVFDEPTATTIDPSNNEYSYDILSISSYGEIRSIAHSIIPAELAEPIILDNPVKALLYVEGGRAKKLGIMPEDKAQHGLFPKRPEITE